MNFKKWPVLALLIMLGAMVLVACGGTATPETVIETREVVVTQEVVIEGTPQVVTQVVQVTVEVTPEPQATEPPMATPKDLIICMAQEPETLYTYGGNMLAQRAVEHAFTESPFNTLSYDYQPVGLVKMPSLADGDAVINSV